MRGLIGRAAVLVVVVVVTAGATLWITSRDGGPAAPAIVDSGGIVLTRALQPFDGCQPLRDHFVAHALDQVGPYGLDGYGPIVMQDVAGATTESAVAATARSGAAESDTAATSVASEDDGTSGTNVQEAGVDEADIVKADDRMLVTATAQDNRLRLVDLTGSTPRPAGTVDLPGSWQQDLFLAGDRVLVMSAGADPPVGPASGMMPRDIAPGGMPAATSSLTLIDVSNVDAPRVLSQLTLDGSHVSARLTDGVARVVMRSGPVGLPFVHPEGGGLNAEREAEEANRRIITDSTIDNWLPAYVLADGQGNIIDEGRMLDCENVHRPETFAGLGLTTVLNIDIDADFVPRGGTAVITSGDTVYASPDSLYIATQSWTSTGARIAPVDTETSIHRFSLADPSRAVHTGSGTVEGRLLSQWAMSEHEGYLRVATTTGEGESSQSSVIVMDATDQALAEVGRVDGLGITERIYAVRYMGDRGYVVTFRQTDPLYVLDLSDPAAPQVEGELKIPGFSSYLHPVAEGRLLGVGQDATEEGRTTGLQASLFDVSDPTAPQRLATLDLGQGYSPVESDHRAFLYWEPEKLAVLPVERFDMPMPVEPSAPATSEDTSEPGDVAPSEEVMGEPFLGAVAIGVDGDRLTIRAQFAHPVDAPGMFGGSDPIVRIQVVDGRLLTIGHAGIGYGPVEDLDDRAFVRF